MRLPGWILGFHGCDHRVAEQLLAGKDEILASSNAYDWLGAGAYFWENNPSRALAWAKFLASPAYSGPRKIKQPAVIGAIIDPGLCLDLTEEASLTLIQQAHANLVRAYSGIESPMPVNEPGHPSDNDFVKRYLDCAVINFLHQTRAIAVLEPFDTVRAPFLEGGPLYEGAKIAAKTHVQWCVRSPKRGIIGYFRPRNLSASHG